MKRKSIIIILSAVTMLIVLVGCGGNKSGVNTNNNISNQEKTALANNENPIPQRCYNRIFKNVYD